MEKNHQRVIELYNSIQERKKELKGIQQQYRDLHRSILDEKIKALQEKYPDVNLTPSFMKGKPLVVGLNVKGNGWDCRLYINYSASGFCCGAVSNAKMMFEDFDSARPYDERFIQLAPSFVGIFERQSNEPDFFSEFPPYQFDEAFECFAKAYDKFIELGGQRYEITKKKIDF